MPAVEMATLCNGVTYRGGLLSMLEAGVERFEVPGFPAKLPFVALLWLRATADDIDSPDAFEVQVLNNDGEVIDRANSEFTWPGADDPDFLPHFAAWIPLVVPVAKPGAYTVRMTTTSGVSTDRLIFVRSV